MREIKFRVWDDKVKSFLPSYKNSGLIFERPENEEGRFGCCDLYALNTLPERYLIQQYTGLEDANGQKIYEGDIVECCYGGIYTTVAGKPGFIPGKGGFIAVVSFETDDYTTKTVYKISDNETGVAESKNVEVIGNIFEDLTLL